MASRKEYFAVVGVIILGVFVLGHELWRDTPQVVRIVSANGFHLDLPKDWQGLYRVVDLPVRGEFLVHFSWGGGPDSMLLAVYRVPADVWQGVEHSESTTVRKLDELGGYVYYGKWQAKNPLSGHAADLFQAMSRDVSEVLDTFGLEAQTLNAALR